MFRLILLSVSFYLFQTSYSRTFELDTDVCFGLPAQPLVLMGVSLASVSKTGRAICYLNPPAGQYFRIFIKSLDLLSTVNGDCPFLTIDEYFGTVTERVEIETSNLFINVDTPGNKNNIFTANCSNYLQLPSTLSTSASDRSLQISYMPTRFGQTNKFKLVASSYSKPACASSVFLSVRSAAFSCPSEYFRCWDDSSICIPDSLTCDGVNNCLDGSDEYPFLCTGRIGGIPLPLF
ncbi:hypothetical protein Ciccas_011099, partial [Cichlidogyrus casuarinus]